MMFNRATKFGLATLAASFMVSTAPVMAQECGPSAEQMAAKAQKKKKRKVKALGAKAYKAIEKANEAIAAELYDEASQILAEARTGRAKLNSYELSVTYQLDAQIAFGKDDQKAAIAAYEEVLKYREEIPEGLETQILFNLSQLWSVQDDLKKGLEYYKAWEDRTTQFTLNNKVYAAQLYYQLEDYQPAVCYINLAIDEAEASETEEVKENWYGMRFGAEYALENLDAALSTTETLVLTWPSPQYWLQMAQLHQELNNIDTFYSLVEAAYEQGYLNDKPKQIVNVANILGAREVPIKGAWLIEDALRAELIEDNADNQLLLGRMLYAAREYERAVTPLSRAAQGDDSLDPSAATWMQVAYTLSGMTRNEDAINAFDRAIELFEKELKEKPKSKTIKKRIYELSLSQGMAYVDLKRFNSAKASFDQASKYAATRRERRSLKTRVDYMKDEQKREKILADALK